MRWVGALEIVGPSNNRSPIWGEGEFPIRFEVKPIVVLDPEHGIPMESLLGKVDFYASRSDAGKFKGFVRRSPNAFTPLRAAKEPFADCFIRGVPRFERTNV